MSLLRNSSETDESIPIEIPFICILTVESFGRIERIARSHVRNVVGGIISEMW